MASLTESIDRFGGSGNEYYQRAKLYLEQREMQKAADDAVMALKMDSTNLDYLYLLSDIQVNGYQSRQGLETILHAVKIDPLNQTSLLKLLETQILLKQFMPALGTSQRLLQLDPQDHKTFFLRGLLFKEQGLDSLAIVNLQRTVDLDPTLTGAFVMLGDLHEKKSDPLALGYYQNAIATDPENVNALHALAFYEQNHGKIESALEHYSNIIEINPKYTAAFINKGILELSLDSLQRAKKSLNQGYQLDTSFPIALYYLGELAIKQGNTAEAKKHLNKAIKLDPEYQAAKELLQSIWQLPLQGSFWNGIVFIILNLN